jgi:hypothetical protein
MKALKNGKFKTLKIWEIDSQDSRKMILLLLQVTNQMMLLDQHNMKRIANSSHVIKLKTITLLPFTRRIINTYQDQEHIRMWNLLLTGFQKVQPLIK